MRPWLRCSRPCRHRASSSPSRPAGTGTPGHLAGEYLSAKLPGKLVHVPYKGAGPALNDIIGGHVDMYFPGFPPVMPLMKAGTVKVLAVSSAQRSQAAPEIPTVAEATGFAISISRCGRDSSRRAARRRT